MSLRAAEVTRRLGNLFALREVSVEARRGELTAIIGPNGAGKSTLLRLLAGLETPSSGEVSLGGRDVQRLSRRERAAALSFLAQGEALPPEAHVREAVSLGLGAGAWLGGLLSFGTLSQREEDAVNEALQSVGLLALAERRISELSGGEAQRAALARALVASPQYLLLDEPTNHLDLGHAAALLSELRRLAGLGLGVVAVLHDLNLAARADTLWLLRAGEVLAAGPPAEVLTAPLLEAAYGLRAEVLSVRGKLVVLPL